MYPQSFSHSALQHVQEYITKKELPSTLFEVFINIIILMTINPPVCSIEKNC